MKFHVSAMVLVAPMQLAQALSTVVTSAAFSWQSGTESLLPSENATVL